MKYSIVIIFIFSTYIKGSWCIKANLEAIPPIVRRGENTVLKCTYELQGASLYTIKWYKGEQSEFYRYTPKEIPPKKMFNVPGIHVDPLASNETQVVLTNMDLGISGNFTCEVSAEASFKTAVVKTHVEVVSLPESGPVIYSERTHYNVGDTLKANCSTNPSKPAVNLSLFINDEMMVLAPKYIHKSDNGLEWSEVSMTEPLTDFHFKRGRLILKCVAQMRPLYNQSAIAIFNIPSDPKPEKIIMEIQVKVKPFIFNLVTSGNSSCKKIQAHFILLIAMLLIVLASSSPAYEDYFYDVNDYDVQEIPEEIKKRLITV